jgi:hypothetical protein
MRLGRFFALVFLAISGYGQSLHVIPVSLKHGTATSRVSFFCSEDYDTGDCLHDLAVLNASLARFPIGRIEGWSFVVVTSDRWKALLPELGGNAGSPAFSVMESRTTAFEESLFSAPASRRAELLRLYGLSGDALLELAVSHELGHALCTDTNESHADEYGRQLRAGKIPICDLDKPKPVASAKTSPANQ